MKGRCTVETGGADSGTGNQDLKTGLLPEKKADLLPVFRRKWMLIAG
jgi:hypothetical protein